MVPFLPERRLPSLGQVVTRATGSEGDEEMTRTISLIIGIAVVALVAVPTALGEGRLAGSEPQSGVAYFKANELTTLVQQPVQVPTNDLGKRDMRFSQVPTNEPGTREARISPPVSGTDIEWQQLGIGLGLGIALAFGLVLMFRATRHERPLAH